jgi:GNAT superfamily N-acetyltransferase
LQNNHIRELNLEDIRSAAYVYSSAFYEDPFWKFFYPEPKKREIKLEGFFRCILRFEFYSGVLLGIGDPLQGCALWNFPNKGKKRNLSIFKIIFHKDVFRFIIKRDFPISLKALRIFIHNNKMHKKYAPDSHYYLSILGVLPTAQGKGLGSKLILNFLNQINGQNVAVYLETMKDSNVSFYKKLGFDVQEEWSLKNTPLKVWALLKTER